MPIRCSSGVSRMRWAGKPVAARRRRVPRGSRQIAGQWQGPDRPDRGSVLSARDERAASEIWGVLLRRADRAAASDGLGRLDREARADRSGAQIIEEERDYVVDNPHAEQLRKSSTSRRSISAASTTAVEWPDRSVRDQHQSAISARPRSAMATACPPQDRHRRHHRRLRAPGPAECPARPCAIPDAETETASLARAAPWAADFKDWLTFWRWRTRPDRRSLERAEQPVAAAKGEEQPDRRGDQRRHRDRAPRR